MEKTFLPISISTTLSIAAAAITGGMLWAVGLI